MVSIIICKSSTIAGRCSAGEGYGQTLTKEGRQAKFARIECEHFDVGIALSQAPVPLPVVELRWAACLVGGIFE